MTHTQIKIWNLLILLKIENLLKEKIENKRKRDLKDIIEKCFEWVCFKWISLNECWFRVVNLIIY